MSVLFHAICLIVVFFNETPNKNRTKGKPDFDGLYDTLFKISLGDRLIYYTYAQNMKDNSKPTINKHTK